MSQHSYPSDLEAKMTAAEQTSSKHAPVLLDQEVAGPGEILSANDRTLFGRINLYMARFQVEARGIERVPDDERVDKTLSNAATVVSTIYPLPQKHYHGGTRSNRA
jgi:hypothetical protein